MKSKAVIQTLAFSILGAVIYDFYIKPKLEKVLTNAQ